MGAQTGALPLFCDRDIEIDPMTLKHEGDLDILKMYILTLKMKLCLRHLRTQSLNFKNTKIKVKGQGVKMSKALNYFERYHNRYMYQAPAFSDR